MRPIDGKGSPSRREFAALLLTSFAAATGAALESLVFCCSGDNDLYRTLSSGQSRIPRFDNVSEAIEKAGRHSGVLMLADEYPEKAVELPKAALSQARDKGLRLYVEFVRSTGEGADQPRTAKWERAVVASDFFAPSLTRGRLLSLHRCRYLPSAAFESGVVSTHLTVARVAGFDTAVFGIPAKDNHPLLVENRAAQMLVATSALSRFITARYEPVNAWTIVWKSILTWLSSNRKQTDLIWTPAVRPSFAAQAELPAPAEGDAVRRGSHWYSQARLLIHPSWAHRLEEAHNFEDQVGPAPSQTLPVGDGSLGILEGHSSRILPDGSQPARWWIRADCTGEAAMVLSLVHKLNPRDKQDQIARNLVDFLLLRSRMATGLRLDSNNAAYGLLGWNETPNYYKGENGYDVYYGDDNARALLGVLIASSILAEPKWDERFWLAVLANFRLIGTEGFQKSRYDQAPLAKNGWRSYHDAPIVLYDMNYEAYPWALFLWAFAKTGYVPFFERTERGLRLTMEAYPNHWRWSNSITSSQARILLPLAWLVRVKDSAQARSWLHRVAQDLLAHQHESGAIFEWTGPAGTGIQVPPTSNEKYGTGEGTLIQQNGNPVADLLYTMNFAFIGFHEAHAATGEKQYKETADKIADFLVRAQVRSEAHPEFNGAWYRAFDFGSWDYWASNSDSGWGAWCTEAGWSQSWISTTFALRLLKRSLWEIAGDKPAYSQFDELRKQMFA
jgi:hypothetical protein